MLRYLVGDTRVERAGTTVTVKLLLARLSPLVLHVVGEGGAGGDVDHEAATAAHRQALPGLKETTAQQRALQIDLN